MKTWTVPGYTTLRDLGSGASGHVVLAVHQATGIQVAVKYLSDSLLKRPEFLVRFRMEAQVLAGLDSDHVIGLYEYVESAHGAAIVMEVVHGLSLRQLLVRQGSIEPEAALLILKGSLLGLADTHSMGVVHRDYKPENVLVKADGTSKLVDFGIAVSSGVPGSTAGTPLYMAPEMWNGAPATPATDVYAATATFLECLTGHHPYSAQNVAELAIQHVTASIPVEGVPAIIQPVVLRGMAKMQSDRYPDAEAFVTELESAANQTYGDDWEERGRSTLATLVASLLSVVTPGTSESPQASTDIAITRLGRRRGNWGRSFRMNWTMGVTAAAVLGIGGIVLVNQIPLSSPVESQPKGIIATTRAQLGGTSEPDRAAHTSATAPTKLSASVMPTASIGHPNRNLNSGPASYPTLTSESEGRGDHSHSPNMPNDASATAEPDHTAVPSSKPSSSSQPPPPAPAPSIKEVKITRFEQTGALTANMSLHIRTDGDGPFSLKVTWYTGEKQGDLGQPDGEPRVFERNGYDEYTLTLDHTVVHDACFWSVEISSDPASVDGSDSRQLLAQRCVFQ
ncbi:serine/threonine-protein kinase [Streptomyces sp900105245]|uniref:mitogen-activated protein kinase kinase n=1 Tax=Streptomyces sp. 900105245 TaxID=3154379 RepID=A0ABV1ULG7_9ACTN